MEKYIGKTFARLTVISTRKNHCVDVSCSCGKNKTVYIYNLTNGKTKSCGCLRREENRERFSLDVYKNRSINERKELKKMYGVLKSATRRCHDPLNKQYKSYGGRGIAVCKEWREKHGFNTFVKDMGIRPNGGTLDRIDNNKGYSKDNCRWATWKENQSNRRDNLKYKGVTAAEGSRLLGGNETLVSVRMRRGWPEHDAFTKEVRQQ